MEKEVKIMWRLIMKSVSCVELDNEISKCFASYCFLSLLKTDSWPKLFETVFLLLSNNQRQKIWRFEAGFMVFTHWISHFQIKFRFHSPCVWCIFMKVLTHTRLRKAFKKIAKLKVKLRKHWIGCLCPMWSLLSAAYTSHDHQNYLVTFSDQSTNGILLPNQ